MNARRSSSTLRRAGVTAAVSIGAVLLAAGSAAAQSCERTDPATSVCRFVLSQPRAFTAEARARVEDASAPVFAALRLSVDGQVCHEGADSGAARRTATYGACRLSLPAGQHVVSARLTLQAPDGRAPSQAVVRRFEVVLTPNPRLASLPREAGELYPHDRRHAPPWWPLPF